MYKLVIFIIVGAMVYADSIVLEPLQVYSTSLADTSNTLDEEQASNTNSITLEERLKRDVAYYSVPEGEGAVSFRGVDYKCKLPQSLDS